MHHSKKKKNNIYHEVITYIKQVQPTFIALYVKHKKHLNVCATNAFPLSYLKKKMKIH